MDAMDFEIENEEKVKVVSRNGMVESRVEITDSVPPGVTYMTCRPEAGVLFKKERACSIRIEKIN
jgi:anaerobic selenocysteine-containing dehydrogenase